MITQSRLKELMRYDPLTGVFTRRVARGSVPAGAIAGTPDEKGYLRLTVDRRQYRCHRMAFLYMDGAVPQEVDHKNRVRDDNRWANLRSSTRSDNMRNAARRECNTTGVVGVSFRPRRNRWVARITVGRKRVQIGTFMEFSQAVEARIRAELRHGYSPTHGASL